MTLLWSDQALAKLQQIRADMGEEPRHYVRLVRRLTHLENDASTFEAVYNIVDVLAHEQSADAGPLKAHVMEADPGAVFVLLYRLAVDAEDVWLVGLHHGR